MKQIKKMVYSLLLSVCCATMFTACSEEEGVVDAKDLELSKEELVFLAEPGESQSVTFVANADWKASSEQGWILIETPVGKKGESTVTVNVKKNTEKVSRQGNVVITEPSTGKMASFKVSQEAEGVNFAPSKESGEFVIDNENKVISDRVSIAANFKYDIQIKGVDWVTYSIDESTNDIIFYADNEKATIEPKDITVEFVPVDEENVQTQTWNLKWGGFTPSVEFYKDEACTQPIGEEGILIEESMNGYQAKFFIKSTVTWNLTTDLKESILSSVTNSDEGNNVDRIFESVTHLFAVYNEEKLSRNDQKIELTFEYNSNATNSLNILKNKELDFIKINNEDFKELNAGDIAGDYMYPMFDYSADNNGILSLDFTLETFYNKEEIIPMVFDYDMQMRLYKGISNWNIRFDFIESISIENELKKYKYRITFPDRVLENLEGEDRYFRLFFVSNTEKDDFLNNNFDKVGQVGYFFKEENANRYGGNLIFGQKAYLKGFYFEPVGDWNRKIFEVSKSTGSVVVSFKSDLDLYSGDLYLTLNAQLSDDSYYIVNEDEFYGNDLVDFPELGDIEGGYSLKFNYNMLDKKEFTMYIGGRLGDKIQYLGEFTVRLVEK